MQMKKEGEGCKWYSSIRKVTDGRRQQDPINHVNYAVGCLVVRGGDGDVVDKDGSSVSGNQEVLPFKSLEDLA